MCLRRKKKFKNLIRFHSAKKLTTTTEGQKRKEKKSKGIYRTSQTIRIRNVFLEPLLSESFPLLEVAVHLTSLLCPPKLLISGPAVGATQILIWSYSCVFLPPVSTALRTSAFSFVGFSMSFYIFHRHRVCLVDHVDLSLVDHVDLICSLYSWWEGFGSSSLATLPLGFNCGFIFTSACGSSTGVWS